MDPILALREVAEFLPFLDDVTRFVAHQVPRLAVNPQAAVSIPVMLLRWSQSTISQHMVFMHDAMGTVPREDRRIRGLATATKQRPATTL